MSPSPSRSAPQRPLPRAGGPAYKAWTLTSGTAATPMGRVCRFQAQLLDQPLQFRLLVAADMLWASVSVKFLESIRCT